MASAQRIGIEQAELRWNRKQSLQQSVERAHRDARNATETLAAAERAEASAKLAFDNAELRFEQGLDPSRLHPSPKPLRLRPPVRLALAVRRSSASPSSTSTRAAGSAF